MLKQEQKTVRYTRNHHHEHLDTRLNRFLSSKKEKDIVRDTEFKESNKIFLAVCKDLKRQGFGGVEHHPPIDESDLNKMYQMFDLQNPKYLQWSFL